MTNARITIELDQVGRKRAITIDHPDVEFQFYAETEDTESDEEWHTVVKLGLNMLLRSIGHNSAPAPNQQSKHHYEVLEAMEAQGGGFVVKLANAWRHADANNHARLCAVFGDYYTKYAGVAALNREGGA